VTPDRNGGTGSAAIAEEVFTNYLMETRACRVIEKHSDVLAGFVHPSGAGAMEAPVPPPSAPASPPAGGFMAALPLAGGGAAVVSSPNVVYDNAMSNDILLERHKKRAAQKVLIFRIDELEARKAIIHFRFSDASTGMVESSATIPVEQEAPKREGGRRK
jgi:hypothetical protein